MPGATALITAERYGILYSSVETLNDSTSVIEIPVSADFFPGVYVSVSLFSKRVDKPSENGADLGKPAEWTGYIKVPVYDDLRRINVSAKTDKASYRPRERAKLTVKATLPAGKRKRRKRLLLFWTKPFWLCCPTARKPTIRIRVFIRSEIWTSKRIR